MIESRDTFYTQSEDVAELFTALSKFQGAMPPVPRTKEVVIRGKSKKTGRPFELRFKYAPLEDIVSALQPHLEANGLHWCQFVTPGPNGVTVATRVGHSSGQYQISEFRDFPFEVRSAKEIGIAETYARRYALAPMLGIATEEDTDAPDLQSDNRSVEYVNPRISKMLGKFQGVGVGRDRLEFYMKKKVEDLDADELRHLGERFVEIEDNADRKAAILETFGPSPSDRMESALEGGKLFEEKKNED